MAFSAGAFFRAEFARHLAVAEATAAALEPEFAQLVASSASALKSGGKLIFFGNGGSAADAQHLATELVVRYARDRRPLPAVALAGDGVLLTAAANDLGFDRVFSRQIEALGRAGDLAIALSTSGRSANVLAALDAARACGMGAAALTGQGGGNLVGRADPLLLVPSEVTARIQEMHITLGHMLCAALEAELGVGS